MDGRREFTIRVDPKNCTIILEQETRGVTQCKELDPADLYTCIATNTFEKDKVTSGILPAGCVSVSLSTIGKKFVALEYQQRHADIWYYSRAYKHFPLPRLVFGFLVDEDGRVIQALLCVVKDEPLTEETVLYQYPFSNVRSNSSICMGDNVLPTVKSLGELSKLASDILKMPNNEDFFDKRDNRQGLSYEKLLELLKDKEPSYYYDHILIPKGKTLGSFLGVSLNEVE